MVRFWLGVLGIIMLLSQVAYTQSTEDEGNRKSKIKVRVTAGPEANLTIPSDFGTRKDIFANELTRDTIFKFIPQLRFRLGMCLRFDFSKLFSFQTGLYFIERRYDVKVGITDGSSTDIHNQLFAQSFNYIGYELPLMGLFYVQLGEKWFMNNAVGFSMDFFPSHTEKVDPYQDYVIYNARRSWVIPSVKASVGFEFRTENSGYFYLGGQFHRPLIPISDTFVERKTQQGIGYQTVQAPVSGTYFAIDIKYFFNPGKKAPW